MVRRFMYVDANDLTIIVLGEKTDAELQRGVYCKLKPT